MKTALFDFVLPQDMVALRPVVPRDAARLLVVRGNGGTEHCHIGDLPFLLQKGDILAVNDSKVIPARLRGTRRARRPEAPPVQLEILLHRQDESGLFHAFAQPARRLREGDIVEFGQGLSAYVVGRSGPETILRFGQTGSALQATLVAIGETPLPPYIARQRPADARDRIDYQTVYADQPGSVAAPTAGLHFTQQLLERLAEAGIGVVRTTLHVGAGTFLPVAVEETGSHKMHAEHAHLAPENAEHLNQARQAGGRIIAAGTTALRTLESAAGPDGIIRPFDGDTDIFITPGYRFRAVDVLLTNFHLPRSTLFMLVSAFMGLEVMQAAYAEAIREKYRFYSYGDACLLFRPL